MRPARAGAGDGAGHAGGGHRGRHADVERAPGDQVRDEAEQRGRGDDGQRRADGGAHGEGERDGERRDDEEAAADAEEAGDEADGGAGDEVARQPQRRAGAAAAPSVRRARVGSLGLAPGGVRGGEHDQREAGEQQRRR